MIFTDFPGSNTRLGPPEGMTEEQVTAIRARRSKDDFQREYFMVSCRPSYEDIEAIKAGRPVFIKWMTAEGLFMRVGTLGLAASGYTFVQPVSAWIPGPKQYKGIIAGFPLVITILSSFFPPVSIYTHDEKGIVNE